MQHLKQAGVALMLGVVIAACGGKAPTQAPDGNGGNGGTPTEQPATTEDNGGNGGNGGIGFENGKVTFTVDGPIKTSGELGFIPQASAFGGDQGSALSFGDSQSGGTGSLVSIVITGTGEVAVSYAGPAGQVPGATCKTSDWNVGSNSASGKFDCTAELAITASGATVSGATIKGEFTAHT